MDVSLATAYREVKKYRASALPHPSLFRNLIVAEVKLRGVDTVVVQGKQIIYLEKKIKEPKGIPDSNADSSTQKYVIVGAILSIVAAMVAGLYYAAGKKF